MALHSGHRQRLKDRFRQDGLDGFNELNALELLLFYCIPQKDTNPLAHHLLDHFGSFHAVLDASPEELEKVEGVGHNISTFLSLIPQVDRYYYKSKNENVKYINNIEEYKNYIVPYFRNKRNESVCILCLDGTNRILTCRELGEGGVNSAGVPLRKIVDTAMKFDAVKVILAHNHPSGDPKPSIDDIQATKTLARALAAVDIILEDHVVVVGDRGVSMAQTNVYRPSDFVTWR